MSMRSSFLLCVKFLQENSSRRLQEVENCSTFQRSRTAEKDLNMAVSCWEVQWDWYVSGFELMEGQERVNIIAKMWEKSSLLLFEGNKLEEKKQVWN